MIGVGADPTPVGADSFDRREVVLWGAALLLAFALRAWQPGVVPFRLDEAYTTAIATQIAHLRSFPLQGLRTSFGFHNPPTFFYVVSPPFLVASDPRLPTLILAVLGAAAAGLAGLVARRHFGPRAGLLAVLIVACSANAIEHGRRLWTHDLILPMAALVVWLLYGSDRPRVARAGVAAIVAQTMHLSGGLLLLPVAIELLREPRSTWLRRVGAIGGAAVLLYLPWIIECARTGWADIAAIAAGTGRAAELIHLILPEAAWAMVLGDGMTDDLLRILRPWEVSPLGAVASLLSNAGAVALMAAALAYACVEALRRTNETPPCIGPLAGLAIAPAVLFAVIFRASVPAYMLPALIPVAILGAAALTRPSSGAGRAAAMLVAGAVTLGGAVGALEVRAAAATNANHIATPTVALLREDLAAIRSDAAGRPWAVRQDARRALSGVDVAYVVLHYADTGASRLPVDWTPGTLLYVLVDPQTRMHPALAAHLRSTATIPSRGATIHRLEGASAEAWVRAVDATPPP